MATKEGAERACVNKRPIIDGRRANVDLAYLGAKPKPPKAPQRDDAASPESTGAPASPTNSEAAIDSGTEWAPEEQSPKYSNAQGEWVTEKHSPNYSNAQGEWAVEKHSLKYSNAQGEWAAEKQSPKYSNAQGCHSGYMYDSGHPAPPAAMMVPPAELKPPSVSSMQTFNSNLPLMNTMTYYPASIPSYSSPANAGLVDPKFMDPSAVSLVTFVPQGPVTSPPQNAQSLNMQCLPQYTQVPPQPSTTKLIPNPRYVYTVPVWYVDQGRMSCGQVSLEHVSSYSPAPLNSGVGGSNNGGFSACKMYPIATYY